MIFPFITSIYLFVDFHRDSTSVKKCQKVGLGWDDEDYKKRFSKTKNPKQNFFPPSLSSVG